MKNKLVSRRPAPCAQLAASWPATAQSASGEQDTNPQLFDEIVVTAERRRTDLQKTPISATVMTGEDVANAGVTNVDQLQFISPSAAVNNFGQGIDFNIRGIGKAEHNSQTTTGVITYRDGVATFPGYFTAEPYYDIARVEILRGPQGTFVGENATGGAVFVTSNDPVINGGHTRLHPGRRRQLRRLRRAGRDQSTRRRHIRGARGLQRATSATASTTSKVRTPATTACETGSVRLGMLWEPSDSLSVNFKTDYNYLDLSGYPADPVLATNDLFDITANADIHALDRFGRAVLKIDYEFANGTTLRSVSGYQKGQTEYRADLDGTSVGNNIFGDIVDEEIYSQEINLISSDADKLQVDPRRLLPARRELLPARRRVLHRRSAAGLLPARAARIPREHRAVFGQVSFDMPAGFQLQLGARYSEHTTDERHRHQPVRPAAHAAAGGEVLECLRQG